MTKSSPDKLAQALRANLRRRKGPKGLEGPQDGRAPKRAVDGSPAPGAQPPEPGREKPSKPQG